MSRQTSERFEEISCAILVPLTTIVACSISRRTIRPRRMSVGCSCSAGALAREGRVSRIVCVFLMRELCGSGEKSTNEGIKTKDPRLRKILGRHNPQAHIHRLRRVGQKADRNEIHAGLGVGTNIIEADAAGALQGNAALEGGTALDRAAYVF